MSRPFLDLGARAERHRQAATAYKRAIRHLELLPPDNTPLADLWLGKTLEREDIEKLQRDLAQADADAPIPPKKLAELYDSMPVDIRYRVEDAVVSMAPGEADALSG